MNRLASILCNVATPDATRHDNAGNRALIKQFLALIETGSEEQRAYFPFNPVNPIYITHNICPIVDYIEIIPQHRLMCIFGMLADKSGKKYLDIIQSIKILGDDRLELYVISMSNEDKVSATNKNKNAAAYYINSLQNFLVYSKNPYRIALRTSRNGNHYWAKWFDFDCQIEYFDDWMKAYRESFAESLHTTSGCKIDKARYLIRKLEKPIQFRYVGKAIDIDYDVIGRNAMKSAITWHGKCGLAEMSENSIIRQSGMKILNLHGIIFEHPADFQRIIAKQLGKNI